MASTSDHGSAAEFEQRWTTFFREAEDLFELQRGLNNCFGYDIVPTVAVLSEAMKAARRLDDFATAVRIFGGLRDKVENKEQYKQYTEYLKPLMKELGVVTPEEIGR